MPRIRSIRPTIWADSAFAALSRDARLTLIGLISYADDDGRFVATPAAVAGYVFPYDHVTPARVGRWLEEIDKSGIARIYAVDGHLYGHFPKWSKSQRIQRPNLSALPEPFEQNYVRSRNHSRIDP